MRHADARAFAIGYGRRRRYCTAVVCAVFSPGPAAKGRLANGAGIAGTVPPHHRPIPPVPSSSTPAPRRQGGPLLYYSRLNISRPSPGEPPPPPHQKRFNNFDFVVRLFVFFFYRCFSIVFVYTKA